MEDLDLDTGVDAVFGLVQDRLALAGRLVVDEGNPHAKAMSTGMRQGLALVSSERIEDAEYRACEAQGRRVVSNALRKVAGQRAKDELVRLGLVPAPRPRRKA